MRIFFPPPSAGCSPWPRACYSIGLSKRELKALSSHGSLFKVARLHSSTPKHTECWCYATAFPIPPPQHINSHTPALPLWDQAKDSGKKNQECKINNQWWPCLIHKHSSTKRCSSCNWRSGRGWSQIRYPVSDVVDLIVTTVLGSAFIWHSYSLRKSHISSTSHLDRNEDKLIAVVYITCISGKEFSLKHFVGYIYASRWLQVVFMSD